MKLSSTQPHKRERSNVKRCCSISRGYFNENKCLLKPLAVFNSEFWWVVCTLICKALKLLLTDLNTLDTHEKSSVLIEISIISLIDIYSINHILEFILSWFVSFPTLFIATFWILNVSSGFQYFMAETDICFHTFFPPPYVPFLKHFLTLRNGAADL